MQVDVLVLVLFGEEQVALLAGLGPVVVANLEGEPGFGIVKHFDPRERSPRVLAGMLVEGTQPMPAVVVLEPVQNGDGLGVVEVETSEADQLVGQAGEPDLGDRVAGLGQSERMVGSDRETWHQ